MKSLILGQIYMYGFKNGTCILQCIVRIVQVIGTGGGGGVQVYTGVNTGYHKLTCVKSASFKNW